MMAVCFLIAMVACAQRGLSMKCQVTVPREYRQTPFNPPPNGEPEPVRYRTAYEAFWWNCVAVRAGDLRGRCPFLASGTAAASAGAGDGAMNAEKRIDQLIEKYGELQVHQYLRSIAFQSEARAKMRPYFDKPKPEIVKPLGLSGERMVEAK
jgi:hypothetical protein